jgi:CBS domain-containing protein
MLISDVLGVKGAHVVTIRPEQTVQEAVERLAEHRIGAVVVTDFNKPVGIFSERDLVNRLAKTGVRAYEYEVRALMSTPLITGRLDDTIEDALTLMVRRRIRHLPIVNGTALLGLVSIGDLIKFRLDQKELEASVLLDISRMRA